MKQYDNYADLITFTRASSATYLDSDGILKTASTNIPRIEYDSDGNRLGLLVEEARTNLVTYSEDFDNAAWSIVVGVSRTANTALAPDGTMSGDTITVTTVGDSRLQRNITVANDNTTYCGSFFVKKTTAKSYNMRFQLQLVNGSSVRKTTNINTETGEVSGEHVGVVSDFGDWWQVSLTIQNNSSGNTILAFFLYPAVPDSDIGSSNEFWGAQLEAGSFPTSYIPTSGSTVTRSADVASIGVSEFGYNESEGSFVVETNKINISNTYINIFGSGDPAKQSMFANTTKIFQGDNPFASVDATISGPLKIASSISEDGVSLCVNGGSMASAAAQNAIASTTSYKIGRSWSAQDGTLIIKSIKYFPRKLTDAQLQELTS
jgi:hypothetical protein